MVEVLFISQTVLSIMVFSSQDRPKALEFTFTQTDQFIKEISINQSFRVKVH